MNKFNLFTFCCALWLCATLQTLAKDGDKEKMIINEIMPANLDMFMDPSWNYGGFIELYNTTDVSVSIKLYYLSDDANNLKKWRIPSSMANIPSHGFKTIWFDHNDEYCRTQCSFKLNVEEGGTIYLSDTNGNLVAKQDYPIAIRRCSYARKQDGGDEWGWTGNATPDKTNSTSKFAEEQLSLPVVNKPGQVFTGTLQVTVNIPQGATLRYTTNGSTPTLENGSTSTTGIFTVTKSTPYRFRLFKDGYLPSDVKTCSYIYKDKNFNAPIISIVSDDNNINGAEYGIFNQGKGNGRAGRGQSARCNWNMDWDRPVSFEYIPDSKEVAFAQEVNMAAVGGWSRAWTPHSFKLKANKVYGIKYMPYAFFEDKPYNKNKTLQIRNGGNDCYTGCRIKDAALQSIIARSGIDVDWQDYKPVFVYINGKLYNVLNMREPNNKDWVYANRGISDEDLDQFEYDPDSGYVQKEGTKEKFLEWYNLTKQPNTPENYEKIKQLVDIDEFINYFALEMYLCSDDWLANSNNIKGYCPRLEGGKFRFTLFDLDASFNITGSMFNVVQNTQYKKLANLYTPSGTITENKTVELELATIWLNMLNYQEFRKQFIDAFCLVVGSVFDPVNSASIIKEIATRAASVMSVAGHDSPWNTANEVINKLSADRQNQQINNLKNYTKMQMNGVKSIQATLVSNLNSSKILLNNQAIPFNKFSGTLFLPATITAEAPAGYKFKGWQKYSSTGLYPLFDNDDSWSYYDKGSLDGKNWKATSYSTSGWSTGNAPLGYINGDTWPDIHIKTKTTEKHPTYYFRKTFNLDVVPTADDQFELSFMADDGCVVYINGKEVGRWNMPSGTITYNTFATTYCDQYSFPQVMTIPASYFTSGNNVIAVEVHNNNDTSSDAVWFATLSTTARKMSDEELISTDSQIKLTDNAQLIAIFEKENDEEIFALNHVPVRINEVSADNDVFINDLYKKAPWVELYNTTDKAIDIAGMSLSDNLNKPRKYTFKSGSISTIIEPHGFLVVWCDKKNAESQLHTSFEIENDNDCYLTLTAENSAWADTLQYNEHLYCMSYGRYPDGSNKIMAMNHPTIGGSNIITSYDTIHTEIRPQPTDIEVINTYASNSELSIRYSHGYILAKSEQCRTIELNISTISGQTIRTTTLNMNNGINSYQVHLPAGTYIANIIDNYGNQCATKFIIP